MMESLIKQRIIQLVHVSMSGHKHDVRTVKVEIENILKNYHQNNPQMYSLACIYCEVASYIIAEKRPEITHFLQEQANYIGVIYRLYELHQKHHEFSDNDLNLLKKRLRSIELQLDEQDRMDFWVIVQQQSDTFQQAIAPTATNTSVVTKPSKDKTDTAIENSHTAQTQVTKAVSPTKTAPSISRIQQEATINSTDIKTHQAIKINSPSISRTNRRNNTTILSYIIIGLAIVTIIIILCIIFLLIVN